MSSSSSSSINRDTKSRSNINNDKSIKFPKDGYLQTLRILYLLESNKSRSNCYCNDRNIYSSNDKKRARSYLNKMCDICMKYTSKSSNILESDKNKRKKEEECRIEIMKKYIENIYSVGRENDRSDKTKLEFNRFLKRKKWEDSDHLCLRLLLLFKFLNRHTFEPKIIAVPRIIKKINVTSVSNSLVDMDFLDILDKGNNNTDENDLVTKRDIDIDLSFTFFCSVDVGRIIGKKNHRLYYKLSPSIAPENVVNGNIAFMEDMGIKKNINEYMSKEFSIESSTNQSIGNENKDCEDGTENYEGICSENLNKISSQNQKYIRRFVKYFEPKSESKKKREVEYIN